MTPNFALSLSFEGIRLLHRVADGWALAGEVSLEAPDLASEMKALRDTALGLEPDGLRTKLLLPNDQIKYIEIDTTRTSVDDIHGAIDQETPIPLNELVIDFERTGGRTQIAAVARQTLEEAEAFAKEHGFEPMTFVAVAEPLTFSTEVFFGPTKHCVSVVGPDVEITRDDSPAVLTSVGTLPGFMKTPSPAIPEAAPTVAPSEEPEPAQAELPIDEPDTPDAKDDDVAASTTDEPSDQTDLNSETTESDAVEPEAEPVFSRDRKAPPKADIPAPEDDVPSPETTDDKPETTPDTETSDTETEEPVFASRSRSVEITGARRVPDPTPEPPALAERDAAPSEQSRPATPPNPDKSPIAFFARSGTKNKTDDVSTSEPDAPAIPKPLKATDETPAAPVPVAAPVAVRPAGKAAVSAPKEPRSNPIAPLLAMIKRPQAAPPSKADLALGGAKGKKGGAAAVGGKPKHLGLIMTAALLAFMLIAAVWASSRMENGIAGLFRTPTVADVDETPPVVVAAPAIVDVAAVAPAEDVPATPEPALQPVFTTPPGTVLSPSEAARIYAATGVWQRAPRLPDEAQAGSLDGLVSIATLPVITPNTQPDGPDRAVAAPDRTILAPINPTAPDRNVLRDENGFILAAANGTILPTGVWIYGRKPAITPPLRPTPEVTPAAAVVPADDGTTETDVADADTADAETAEPVPVTDEPAQPETETDVAELADDQTTTPEIETASVDPEISAPEVDESENTTSPEIDEAADGTVVIAGRPALTPPLRPGSAPPDATREDGDLLGNDPALASFRPSLRPDGLVPPPLPEPFADPALAGLRPSVRPADLAPPVVEEDPVVAEETAPEVVPENPDISSIVASIAAAAPPSQIVNPTRNAIVASPRPDSRPRNFSSVVASAQTLAARQQQRNAAAATAAAAVPAAPVATAPARASGPTTATVAQAATVANAIRLRDMNLIGVYGRPGNRRALIRLGSGRYVKVEVGSNLDGGRVTAIGDSALNFVKRGQTYALQMPSG
ncbi:MAG: hypothetical protein ABJO29_12285 [Yoonia sp.]|uniref:hypothetical protein n=1 Tax=Yoonia sp. TaxID=2212373 RepID=UPI003266B5C4